MKKVALLLGMVLVSTSLFAKNDKNVKNENNVTNEKATQLCNDPSKHVKENKVQKIMYENCKRNGMAYWYGDKMQIKSQVNFVDGEENGLYTSFYDNGQERIVVNYTDADKDGVQKVYYSNGVLGEKVTYIKGKREGLFIEWDEEKFKSSEVYYKNNYKVGIKKFFDHKGEITKTEEYKMDRNPVMLKLLKDKRKEILVDLAKYGLISKDAPKEERMR